MSTPKELQRVELLNYTKANGQEFVGLAVELAEDPSGGVQVRVLMDSNVREWRNSGPLATRRLLRLISGRADGMAASPSSAWSLKPQWRCAAASAAALSTVIHDSVSFGRCHRLI